MLGRTIYIRQQFNQKWLLLVIIKFERPLNDYAN